MAKLKLKTKIKEAGSSIRLSGKYIQRMQRVSESESEGETIVRHYQAYKYAKHAKYQCTGDQHGIIARKEFRSRENDQHKPQREDKSGEQALQSRSRSHRRKAISYHDGKQASHRNIGAS